MIVAYPHGATTHVDRAYLAYAVKAAYCARCAYGKGLLDCSQAPAGRSRPPNCPIRWTNSLAAQTRSEQGMPPAARIAAFESGMASHLGP